MRLSVSWFYVTFRYLCWAPESSRLLTQTINMTLSHSYALSCHIWDCCFNVFFFNSWHIKKSIKLVTEQVFLTYTKIKKIEVYRNYLQPPPPPHTHTTPHRRNPVLASRPFMVYHSQWVSLMSPIYLFIYKKFFVFMSPAWTGDPVVSGYGRQISYVFKPVGLFNLHQEWQKPLAALSGLEPQYLDHRCRKADIWLYKQSTRNETSLIWQTLVKPRSKCSYQS